MSKILQATNRTWSDSTATSVFENCPVIHCFTNDTVFSMRTFLIDSVAHGWFCIFYNFINVLFVVIRCYGT